MRFQNYFLPFVIVAAFSCHKAEQSMLPSGTSNLMVISGPKTFNQETIINQEVILYPGALLETTGSGKIVFQKKVFILGESQVFDEKAVVVFNPGTLSVLNPCWFGARGYDEIDDTKAVQKTLDIAKQYQNSINIEFPIGKFLISTTLVLGNELPNRKSINLVGKSMSNTSTDGSSLLWIGANGGVLMLIKNYCVGLIENMDFSKGPSQLMKHNIEMRPYDYLVEFRNCSFAGCAGPGSANVNLNYDNNLQVSEIAFDNCIFRGYTTDGVTWETEAAVIGGYANTKDFYFNFCSLLGFNVAAINLLNTDILRVENCTFAHNTTDIVCLVCNTLATSNYSEHSGSFFRAAITNNVSFTTLLNNYFYGAANKDYVITQGGGNLVMINNNFGGMGGDDLLNKIGWDAGPFSDIYSVGNFFRNGPKVVSPFEFSNSRQAFQGHTYHDIMGTRLEDIREFKVDNRSKQE